MSDAASAQSGAAGDAPPPRRTAAPVLWCVLAAALFGASTPGAKLVVADLGPFTLAGLLYLGAALGVLPFCFRGGSPVARRQQKNVLRMGGVVWFGGIVGPVLLMFGLAQAPAATVSLWLNLETPATALFAWLFFREHLGARALAAVVLVTTASALLAAASGLALVPAALFVAGACCAWGIDNNLSSLVDGFTPAQSTFVKGVAAGTTNLVLGLVMEAGALDVQLVGAALLLGALAYGASIMLYVSGSHHLGAVRSQMIFSSAPFFGVVLAWLVMREPLAPAQLGAAALMIGALGVVYSERHGHAHTHERVTHTHWHRHDDGHHAHPHEGETGDAPGWHIHEHTHEPVTHEHRHRPDLHHRHPH